MSQLVAVITFTLVRHEAGSLIPKQLSLLLGQEKFQKELHVELGLHELPYVQVAVEPFLGSVQYCPPFAFLPTGWIAGEEPLPERLLQILGALHDCGNYLEIRSIQCFVRLIDHWVLINCSCGDRYDLEAQVLKKFL